MKEEDRPYIADIRACGWCDEQYCANCASNDPELKLPGTYCSKECEEKGFEENQK